MTVAPSLRCARVQVVAESLAPSAPTASASAPGLPRAGGGEMWEKCRKGVARRLAAMRTRDERLP